MKPEAFPIPINFTVGGEDSTTRTITQFVFDGEDAMEFLWRHAHGHFDIPDSSLKQLAKLADIDNLELIKLIGTRDEIRKPKR